MLNQTPPGQTPPGSHVRPTRSRPIQIVVTPGSGDGRAMATALELRNALAAHRYLSSLEVFPTLGALRKWTETPSKDFSVLLCVGGDGTQSTTALAALRRSVPFLPVSSGFGNLFAQAFGHHGRVEEVLSLLKHGRIVHSDVGTCNDELFLCQQSYGLIPEVQDAVEAAADRPRARWQRWLAYYGAAVRHLRDAPPRRLRVLVDGRVVAVDAALVIVANVKTYGAWLPLAPNASPVDGLLDVFVMSAATHREVIAKLLRRHLRIPGSDAGTLLCRGQRVSVSGLKWGRDQIEVLRHRLPVVVSPATAAALERDRTWNEHQVPLVSGLMA
ncbi:MAG TPA: diacylglycerol kinase family protein [Methylomirabilota bacterium]|nr:diacylglycerol kinase family protein [Methylomirabilota bacterium]